MTEEERAGYSLRETARRLGVTQRFVADRVRDGTIPCTRLGPRTYRVPRGFIEKVAGKTIE